MIELILDASSIELYEPCPRKYFYSQFLSIEPVHSRRAFDIGSYYHDVLAHYYSSPLKDTPRLRDTFDFSKQAELFSKYNIKSIDEQAFHRRRLTDYFNLWWSEDDTMEVIAVEQGFTYLLYEDNYKRYILEGKIDLINRCSPYGINVMDHKTQSRKDDRYPLNHQVLNYVNYMTNHSPIKRCDYFVYNYIGLQDKLLPDGMRRQICQVPSGMLEQWESDVIKIFNDMYDKMLKGQSTGTVIHGEKRVLPDIQNFERRRSACSNKYGTCEFCKLCSIPDNSKFQEAVLTHYKAKEIKWKAW